jgi:hypothetical protein
MNKILLAVLFFYPFARLGQSSALKNKISNKAEALESKVIEWRRDFHQNPELGNREFKTAEKIAAHLRSLE